MGTKEAFALKIKQLRKANGLTQASLAEAANCSHSTIRDYENLATFPGPEMLEKLARALSVNISDLFNASESVAKVKTLPVSKTLQKLATIPDDVYDLAESLNDLSNEEWDTVRTALEHAVKVKEARKKDKNHA